MSWSYVWSHLGEVAAGCADPRWLVACGGVAWFLYWARRSPRWPWPAVVLRCVAWCSVVAVLAGVHLRVALPEKPMAIVALVDRSHSIDETGRAWQDRYLKELDRWRSPQDPLALVVFAGEPTVQRWLETGSLRLPLAPPVDPEATNIARALEAAVALVPSALDRRLVLLSDGNETQGEARSVVATLRATNTPLYVAVPPRVPAPGTAIEHLHVPAVVPANTTVALRAVVAHRGAPQRCAVRLWANDTLEHTGSATFQEGTTALSLHWRAAVPGAYHLRLELEPEASGQGAVAASRGFDVSVTAPPRVLLVGKRVQSPLAQAAEEQAFELRRLEPSGLRAGQIDWDAYHVVVWEEPTSTVPADLWVELRRYVQRGGGLVVVGGERTFGDVQLRSTALAELLPLTIEPRRPPRPEREPLSLYLLVDRSNSMGYHIHNRMQRSEDESKLAYARRAALALVEQLRDSDRVGVIAFDSQAHEVAPLAPLAENRGLLEHNVARLQPGGGTDFYDALQQAAAALVRQRSRLAHIILLTDGDTNRSAEEHEPVLELLERSGITVTTIRIGDDTVNLEFLQAISQRTGGNFHHVRDASELPQLLLRDTSRALSQSPRGSQMFAVRPGNRSQVLQGIDWTDAPPLHGYAFAHLKPEAEAWLRIAQHERSDPLLAGWSFGAGRVVAFAATWAEGAESWLGWPANTQLWAQVLRWSARDLTSRDVAVKVRRADHVWQIVLESFAGDQPAEARGRLVLGDHVSDLYFRLAGDRELASAVAAEPGQAGELTIWLRAPGRSLEERRFVVYFPRDGGHGTGEAVREPNLALLEALARETGGAVDASAREIAARPAGGKQFGTKTLEWVFLPLAMLAFVADVAIRKLRP